MPIDSRTLPLGSRLPWFSLTSLDGECCSSELLPADKPALIMFLCRHSPYVVHIQERLGPLTDGLMDRGVAVLGIAPNDPRAYPSDAEDQLRAQAARFGFHFPYCMDHEQRAAKAFGASCTPEFFLYSTPTTRSGEHVGRRLVYHGQFDDSRPGSGSATGASLEHAVETTLEHGFVPGDQRPSFGCSIKWTAGNEPSYLFD